MLGRTLFRRIPQGRQFGAIPAAAVNEFKASTLTNGIQLVSKESASNLVSFKFAVIGGSSAESEAEKGAAHLLSVAAFAGTTNKNGLRLMRELEDIGATVSASADREKITIDVTVMAPMAELAFERVAETILLPPKNKFVISDCFGAAQLAYDALASTPRQMLAELLHEAAYGEATPMGSSSLASDLHHLAPEAVLAYRQHQYTSNNLIIAASGLAHDNLTSLTEKYLKSLADSKVAPRASPYTGGDAKLKADFNGKTYCALAFPVANPSKPYNVLRTLLNNKLAKTLNVNTGEISTFYAPYANSGLWGIYATGDSSAVSNKLLETAIAELKNISNNTISAADLETAKNQLTLQKTSELESEAVTCALLSSALSRVTPQEYVNYQAVTANDVANAAKASIAKTTTPTYAILGKTAGAHNFAAIVKLLSA